MKKFDYQWEINGQQMSGVKIAENEAALKAHIELLGGKLVKINHAQDVSASKVQNEPLTIIPQSGKALNPLDGFSVRQEKEWGEILTDFECRNRYTVLDREGRQLYQAAEENKGFLLRWFLRALRPFTLHIFESGLVPVMVLKRPFRFYFHQLDVYDANDVLIGRILRHFHLLNRVYTIVDPAAGKISLVLHGPVLHPWTFRIYQDDKEIGTIKKKWSGFWKETWSDADNFTAEFSKDLDLKNKQLVLAAIFLIDFVHFENTGKR